MTTPANCCEKCRHERLKDGAVTEVYCTAEALRETCPCHNHTPAKWGEIIDDILLDMCVNPDCPDPKEHAQYKPIIRQRILDLLSSYKSRLLSDVEGRIPERFDFDDPMLEKGTDRYERRAGADWYRMKVLELLALIRKEN